MVYTAPEQLFTIIIIPSSSINKKNRFIYCFHFAINTQNTNLFVIHILMTPKQNIDSIICKLCVYMYIKSISWKDVKNIVSSIYTYKYIHTI